MDKSLVLQCWDKLNKKSMPPRSMGLLEEVAVKIACIQRTLRPDLGKAAVVVAAGDHGVYAQNVSLAPQEVTWQHSLSMVKGGGVAGLFSRLHGLDFFLVDVGIKHTFSPDEGIVDRKVVYGTGDISCEAAMTRLQCEECWQRGADFIFDLANKGYKSIIFGEMGIANTTPAAALTGHILNLSSEEVVGEGTGLGPKALANKRKVVQKAIDRCKSIDDPIELMANCGGAELAFLAGGALAAASRRMVIILDGVIVTAAILTASLCDKNLPDYLISAHQSNEPAHRLQLEFLGLQPLLQLKMCLGEGAGAIMAWPLIKEAVTLFNEVSEGVEEGIGDVALSILQGKDEDN